MTMFSVAFFFGGSMKKQPREPRLCDFSIISMSVKRAKLIKIFWKNDFLTHDELIFLHSLLFRAEIAENQIAHVKSMIHRALLKQK